VNWSRHDALYSPAGVWLALATAIFISFALCIALSKLACWLRARKREADESEKEYWRNHG
jgi:hypothetical protein